MLAFAFCACFRFVFCPSLRPGTGLRVPTETVGPLPLPFLSLSPSLLVFSSPYLVAAGRAPVLVALLLLGFCACFCFCVLGLLVWFPTGVCPCLLLLLLLPPPPLPLSPSPAP